MPVRIPASELYQIQEEDLRNAIAEFREGALPPTFEDSTRFDLLVDGYRRFPPKAIIALAARRPLGRVLLSSEFAGGESSTVFRLLLERGFEFATKLTNVAELDATFSVGRNKDTEFVLVESSGPGLNTNYHAGLEAVLRGLADGTLQSKTLSSNQRKRVSYLSIKDAPSSAARVIHSASAL